MLFKNRYFRLASALYSSLLYFINYPLFQADENGEEGTQFEMNAKHWRLEDMAPNDAGTTALGAGRAALGAGTAHSGVEQSRIGT